MVVRDSMRILELFSGTGSFSRVAERMGHETFTVDIDMKQNPSLCKDVLLLDTKDIPFKPDVIWASPPCEQYSHAKRRGERRLDEADAFVVKTIGLIKELNPTYWFMENPQTGLLKKRKIIAELGSIYRFPHKDVSYCKYGLPYRKQTRIWTNFFGWENRICKGDCKFIVNGKHIMSVGNGRRKYTQKSVELNEKYKVPEKLCEEILRKMELLNRK